MSVLSKSMTSFKSILLDIKQLKKWVIFCLMVVSASPYADDVSNAKNAAISANQEHATNVNAPTQYAREVKTYSLPTLGLNIGVENQPPWITELTQEGPQPIFTAQSPSDYHPSTAMTFTSFPNEKVMESQLFAVASTAVERASLNFGLSEVQASKLIKRSAKYGVLIGYESTFHTKLQGVPVDVKVFVGQAKGKYPVALSIYTTAGNMPMLRGVIRRSWENISYL